MRPVKVLRRRVLKEALGRRILATPASVRFRKTAKMAVFPGFATKLFSGVLLNSRNTSYAMRQRT